MNEKYELVLPTGTITATVCERGTKVKVTGHKGCKKIVTAKINNHPLHGRYFQYKLNLWFLDQPPWKKVR